MPDVLLVAATERELDGRDGLVCGIGPVEAASATARALALRPADAVLHIGVAGGRGLAPGTLVIGAEAVYCDLAVAIAIVDRAPVDARLLAAAQAVLPPAPDAPDRDSAAVGGVRDDVAVEAMEGFGVASRELAGAAIEIRAVSNEIGAPDRSRVQVPRRSRALAVTPALLEAIAAAVR